MEVLLCTLYYACHLELCDRDSCLPFFHKERTYKLQLWTWLSDLKTTFLCSLATRDSFEIEFWAIEISEIYGSFQRPSLKAEMYEPFAG